jgi:fatty acid desaturase
MNPVHAEPSVAALRALLEDLRAPSLRTYMLDAGLSALGGWALLALAATAPSWPVGVAALCGSVLLLYRALAFIHESFHQQGLSGFRHFWHATAGIPMLLPLLLYLPIHRAHHSADTYGTPTDGEYERLQGRAIVMVLRLGMINLLLPLALFVRFGMLTPLSMVFPGIRTKLIPEFIHLSMRIPYRATAISGPLARESLRIEWLCTAFCALLLALCLAGQVRLVLLWSAVVVAVAMLNTARAFCSTHLYVQHDHGRNTLGQLADSLNIEGGGLLTALMCPTGLRYHALHHLVPYLPYHALPEAHARLMRAAPPDSLYRRATVPNLAAGWQRMLHATRLAERQPESTSLPVR